MSPMSGQARPKRELKELSLLLNISQMLGRSMDLREVCEPLMRELADEMGMRRGTLLLLNRDTGEIFIEAAHGLSNTQQLRGRYKLGEGVTGKVVQTGQPAVVPRISEEPLFLNRTGAREKLRRKDISFVCVPIKLGTEVIGALSADRLFEENVSFEEDVRLLTLIASMIAQAVKLRQAIQEERQRDADHAEAPAVQRDEFIYGNLVGNSKAMQGVYDQIAQVAHSDTSVLVHGESGTGKELVAHAIHENSRRTGKAFVKVHCAALPETILESELFGHEKGSFTGAIARRKGRFELANGGTIFLDEVGDFTPAIQVKMLRVLQEREFERLGGMETIKVDVRVIAATNRDLEEMIDTGEFRQDLFYRLNVFPIHLPPLRERRADILQLADHFVEKYSERSGHKVVRISTPAIDMLMAYHWPGNVRELENCVERAVLLSDDGVIHGYHLPPTLQTAEASGTVHRGALQATLDNVERELIVDALKSSRGNMAKAARGLGITERVMGLRVDKHRIEPRRFKNPPRLTP